MSFYDDVIKIDPRFNQPTRCADLMMLEPVTRDAVVAIIKDVQTQYGKQMMVFETFRSQARQKQLFQQGATKLQNVGVHNYGLAADIVFVIGGEPSWKGDFSILGPIAKDHGLVWGGNWGDPGVKHTFIDSDHVQRISVADQTGLFSNNWYPDDIYSPYGDSSSSSSPSSQNA